MTLKLDRTCNPNTLVFDVSVAGSIADAKIMLAI